MLQLGPSITHALSVSVSVSVECFTLTRILPLPASAFVPQISMSVKRPQMSVMEASAPTPQGRTSACVSMVSCHRRIWRPAWVTDNHKQTNKQRQCNYSLRSSTFIRFSCQRFTKTFSMSMKTRECLLLKQTKNNRKHCSCCWFMRLRGRCGLEWTNK